MKIPIVFATDENYLFYTITAITSLAENAGKDTFYKIYILVAGELAKGHRLFSEVQAKYAHLTINLLPVDAHNFSKIHINNPHVTKAAFYRLLLGELLPEDKCLYLDSDVIVNTDLSELYEIKLNFEYIAGVRDLWLDLLEENDKEKRRMKINIPSLEQYVNSGVLLFQLDRVRKDKLTEKFLRHMEINYPYEDQDILNVCCYDHIKRLPAKWNLFTPFMGKLDQLEEQGIEQETIRQLREKKGIIHYATPYIRPWKSKRFLCNDIWWKYAEVWRHTPEFINLEKRAWQCEIGYSEEKTALYCASYDTVYIWGFTVWGRSVMTALLERGINHIVGFIDQDEEKQKFTYCGKKVTAFTIEDYEPGKCAIVITSQRSGEEIRKILIHLGVREEDIVCFVQKDEYYHQCLRPEFKEG